MKKMLRTTATLAGLAMIFTLGIHTPASAQQQPTPCGYWSEGVWVATECAQPPTDQPSPRPATRRATPTSVSSI
jgi:hypothetical protein